LFWNFGTSGAGAGPDWGGGEVQVIVGFKRVDFDKDYLRFGGVTGNIFLSFSPEKFSRE
jgi:hypothetical protein